jgi:serine/threonine protein phosphatase PrpC
MYSEYSSTYYTLYSLRLFRIKMAATTKHKTAVIVATLHKALISSLIGLSILASSGDAFQPPMHLRECCSSSLRFFGGGQIPALSCCASTGATSSSIAVGVSSEVGSDPNRPQKVNQDAYFDKNFLGYSCLGVMDGHGLKGHILTDYLSKQLPKRIFEELQRSADFGGETNAEEDDRQASVKEFELQLKTLANFDVPLTDDESSPQNLVRGALIRAFHQAHVDAMKTTGIPAGRSGTTCIVCIRDAISNMLHVAYVGDSRAILLQHDDDDDVPTITTLTTETTVKVKGELARIEQGEGRVDDNGNVWYGPQGIAMTRSLGNAVMLRAGVVPTPVVNSVQLKQESNTKERVIMASDGIWDVLSNEEVAALVEQIPDVQDAANALQEEARRRWIGDLPFIDEAKVDDITCIVIMQC